MGLHDSEVMEDGCNDRGDAGSVVVVVTWSEGAYSAVVQPGARGVVGGAHIIGYVAQALLQVLDWHADPPAALAAPHVLSLGDAVELEADTPAAQLAPVLEARGQKIRVHALPSGSTIIAITPNGLTGAADPRREGAAAGE